MFERGKKEESTRLGLDQDTASAPSESARSDSAGQREAAVIGRSIHINGDLRGEEDLRIEGDVNGTIQLKSNSLTIGKDGKIKADVYAKSVTIDGLVEGDVYGAERVNIRKNARVLGNITAPRVSLEDGARFKGSIEMDPEAIDAALGKGHSAARAMAGPSPNAAGPAPAPKPTAVPSAVPNVKT
jgi:cytoskeletal protein CcmA (bactofilin family)